MFEHADRYYPVKFALCVAIVFQFNVDFAAQICTGKARSRGLLLLPREGDAAYFAGTGMFCQIQRQSAPTTADIEDRHAGLNEQLRGYMAFFSKLCFLKCCM